MAAPPRPSIPVGRLWALGPRPLLPAPASGPGPLPLGVSVHLLIIPCDRELQEDRGHAVGHGLAQGAPQRCLQSG